MNGSASNSLDASNAYGSYGVSPSLWLSSTINTDETGTGTYADPYNLGMAPAPNVLSLSSPTVAWNVGSQILNLTGLFNYPEIGQPVLLWAAACNVGGRCKQKSSTVASNGENQAYSLTWNQDELPSGEYSGTIWAGAHVIGSPSDEDNVFAQSSAVDFTIGARTMKLTIVRGRAFNLVLGDATIFNLTPGTSGGVTVSVDGVTNELLVSGTLATDSALTFGSAILDFKTMDVPESVVINSSLN